MSSDSNSPTFHTKISLPLPSKPAQQIKLVMEETSDLYVKSIVAMCMTLTVIFFQRYTFIKKLIFKPDFGLIIKNFL